MHFCYTYMVWVVVVDEFDNEKRNQLMRANLMVNQFSPLIILIHAYFVTH